MSYGLAPSEAGGSHTYVPITETNVADIEEEAFKGFLHPGQIIEDHAGHLARLLTRQEDGAVVDTLTYSIREIVRNVVEHSSSPSYTFAAQYWAGQNSAELAVADRGCGILSSLKENPKLQVENDLAALKLAILPGISSKAWRKSRSQDAWVNASITSATNIHMALEPSSYESAGNTDLTMSQQKPNGLVSLGRWTAKA